MQLLDKNIYSYMLIYLEAQLKLQILVDSPAYDYNVKNIMTIKGQLDHCLLRLVLKFAKQQPGQCQ